ncbi:hypothetical protein [Roseivirga sp.]|uniref:hypothetical protein n=1 Tax=Roseivirga sp. TaxID=1964215 RepID=UPI003B52A1C8
MKKQTEKPKNNLIWTIIRTLGFYLIGLFNTVLIQQEDKGTWKNYLGYGILLIAVLDTIGVIKRFRRKQP